MESKNRSMNLGKIEKLWRSILSEIGEDPDREGLKKTPERIAKAYKEIFRGYSEENKPVLTIFKNGSDGICCDDMIYDKGYFYSNCEHHGLPFFGEYFFAYIPNKKIVGLSKIARMVDFYSAKLQIQERLTEEILGEITSVLKPKGAILVLKARHLCKEMRGVRKNSGFMITRKTEGVFRNNKNNIRTEFMNFVTNNVDVK